MRAVYWEAEIELLARRVTQLAFLRACPDPRPWPCSFALQAAEAAEHGCCDGALIPNGGCGCWCTCRVTERDHAAPCPLLSLPHLGTGSHQRLQPNGPLAAPHNPGKHQASPSHSHPLCPAQTAQKHPTPCARPPCTRCNSVQPPPRHCVFRRAVAPRRPRLSNVRPAGTTAPRVHTSSALHAASHP